MTEDGQDEEIYASDGNHIAGDLVDLVQRCIVCGRILVDVRYSVSPDNPDPEFVREAAFPSGPVYKIGTGTGVESYGVGEHPSLNSCDAI